MDIQYKFLFPSIFAEVKIDKNLYNKTELVNDIIHNYNLQPKRSLWHNAANIHHYYNDWSNNEFKKLDLSSLMKVYEPLFRNFITECQFKKFPLWQYIISNITVHKESYNFMNNHDHFGDVTFFTAVHYISVDKNSSPLIIENPYSFANYFPEKVSDMSQKLFNATDNHASTYFKHWYLYPQEDTMYIFPSYIKHRVDPPGITSDGHRICVVCNLDFFE